MTDKSAAGVAPPHRGDARTPGTSFLRTVAETIGSRFVSLALAFVTSVVAARTLGPEGRGLFAVALTVTSVGVQLSNLGLHAGNTYAVTRDPSRLATIVANSLAISLCAGTLSALAIWSLVLVVPAVAVVPGPLLAVAVLTIPLGLAAMLLQQLLIAIGRVRAYNLVEIAARLLTLLAIIGLAFSGIATPLAFAFATLLITLISAAAAVEAMRDLLGRGLRASSSLIRAHFAYGLRAYAAALVSFLVIRFDLLMVQSIRGAGDAGQYAVAVALADVIYLLPVTVSSLLFPRLSGEPDDETRRAITLTTAKYVAGLMIPISALAAVLAQFAIAAIYGDAFGPAAPAFALLMPGIALLSVHTVLMSYFAAVGMPRIVILAPLVGLLVNLTLNVWVIPRFGIAGAAASSSVAYAIMVVMSGISYSRSRRSV